jgi:8-oxo-dGTP pyrophosphatase MutT (NUDIX family)
MHTQFDEAEEQALVARYGPTKRREYHLELSEIGRAYWQRAIVLIRRAEVIMIVQRPDGRLLLHTKGHYPPDTYRLPSGGVRWGESVLDALAREQWEELGLRLPAAAMPGIIRYRFDHDRWTIPFASYLFLLPATDEMAPAAQDPTEAISGFRWVQPGDLPAVADHLHTLIRAWGNWGPFRAIAHDVLAETWGL